MKSYHAKTLSLIALLIFSVFSVIFLLSGDQINNADAAIILNEKVVNNFLTAVGDLSKTENYSLGVTKGTYTWTVKNPHITLLNNKAKFEGDVTVIIQPGNIKYNAPVIGEVSVKYNPENNHIMIRVTKAMFEVKAKILGKNVKIADVDLAKYYQIAFDFPGPKPFESTVDVKMPDGKIKKLAIKTVPVLSIENGKIIVGTEVIYTPMN